MKTKCFAASALQRAGGDQGVARGSSDSLPTRSRKRRASTQVQPSAVPISGRARLENGVAAEHKALVVPAAVRQPT